MSLNSSPSVQYRVNSGMLSQFIGQTILLPGKVKNVHGQQAVFETSDHGNVTVHLNQVFPSETKFAEVTGIPERDGSVRMLSYTAWKDDVDMSLLNDLIRYQFNYPEVFS
ncbi:hypothetical protein HMI54_009214 [Coelomomyces lativittatus]|nr:hypothetical protein HMI56_000085 [Coelomomyces lativittatus]KAJ1516498.1 hypothetical protein HMI54_009214 [Coelomomyces lativittatus]KAJ1517730.1 hypothetical protein HMI55_006178 [Coelomomyces lativittatus]